MKPQVLLSIFMLAVMALACNMPTAANPAAQPGAPAGGSPASASDTPAPAATSAPATTATSTLTPLPSDTPTITPTPTPSVPTLTTADKPVNCRFGPGTEWAAVGALLLGQFTPIEGKTTAGDWWYIQPPSNPGVNCWVAATVTVASGNLAMVNVIAPPQALVTNVALTLDPTLVTVPGCSFPYSPVNMTGTITTNGPTDVTWHWELSQGNVSSETVLHFTQFGTKTVSDYVKYGSAGDYWVKLVVTSPNSMSVKTKYKVVCGP